VVHPPGGFVSEDQRRDGGQHPCDGNALELASGQLIGQLGSQVADPDQVKSGASAAHRGVVSLPTEQERQGDVLCDVETGQ
jgi:hypothetical protein